MDVWRGNTCCRLCCYYLVENNLVLSLFSVQLQEFKKFADSADALEAGVALNEGKLCKPLKKLLKKVYSQEAHEQLMVWDAKLGNSIKVSSLLSQGFLVFMCYLFLYLFINVFIYMQFFISIPKVVHFLHRNKYVVMPLLSLNY